MIPEAYITEWRASAPWTQADMVEQDLVINRVLIELYRDPYLAERLAFRGGTALHKLYLAPPVRYSEDIDLVQLPSEPIKETVRRIRALITPWLGEPEYKASRQSAILYYRFTAESDPAQRLRLKLEINTREHQPCFGIRSHPHVVSSRWFSGEAAVRTYHLDELLGTKLRALYQRRKSRDLFDLDHALHEVEVDADRVLEALVHYLAAQGLRITAKQFRQNLSRKLADREFGVDILPLLRPGVSFDPRLAAQLIDDRLLSGLDGAWRRFAPGSHHPR